MYTINFFMPDLGEPFEKMGWAPCSWEIQGQKGVPFIYVCLVMWTRLPGSGPQYRPGLAKYRTIIKIPVTAQYNPTDCDSSGTGK